MRRFGDLVNGVSTPALMGVVAMTPSERKKGRFMRAPEGHSEGGASEGGNNGGENPNSGGNGDSPQNNTGQDFNPRAFWDDPAEEPAPNGNQPNGNGNQPGNQSQPGQNGGDDLGTAISNRVKQFAPPAVMTKEAIEAIGEGNYDKFNEGLTNAIRGSMEQSIGLIVNLMGKFGEHMEGKFQSMLESSHQNRDSKSFLREQVPASKNPELQPIIDSLYDRALKLSKGNREQAVSMTKRMMRAMAEGTASDLNLHVAPVGSDSDPAPTSKTNWLEALNES